MKRERSERPFLERSRRDRGCLQPASSHWGRIAVVAVALAAAPVGIVGPSAGPRVQEFIRPASMTPHRLTIELYLSGPTGLGKASPACFLGQRVDAAQISAMDIRVIDSSGTVVRGSLRPVDEEIGSCTFKATLLVSDSPRYLVSLSEVGTIPFTRAQLERRAWGVRLSMGSSSQR